MVCLGNICRSPSAEAVFRAAVAKRGLSDSFWIDSCGTGGGAGDWYKAGGFSYHEGGPADQRMAAAAASRGIALTSSSRPLSPADVERVDYILAMDAANERAIAVAAEHWAAATTRRELPVSRLTHYLRDPALKAAHAPAGVPDPYYGGRQGFETVLDLLEDACEGLLDAILEEQGGRVKR
jgi:protein-tyrosine phosphatase